LDVIDRPVYELANLLEAGEVSAEELAMEFLGRIDRVDGKIGAFVTVDREGTLSGARSVDRARRAGEAPSRLAGIPVAVKDNMCTRGIETTCSSKMLRGFVPPYDAHVVERVKAAGMLVIGKTNLDEFAMGSSTENSALFVTRNPWNLERVPGGSSGGSAAAVAASEVPAALGSDTGGSVRVPAAYCGVVGMKPTYGLVSRYGVVAYASSLDQVGPLTANVTDCAVMLRAIAGHDPRDSMSIETEIPDYEAQLGCDVAGKVVCLPKQCLTEGIDPVVRDAVLEAAQQLSKLGVKVEEVSLPIVEHALAAYYIIASSEVSSNLARFDGVRYGHRAAGAVDTVSMFMKTRAEGFGREVKRRIIMGTYSLSAGYYDAYYKKAQQVRTILKRDFDRVFERCDALLTPTAPTTAFPIGERIDDPMSMYMSDMCTVTANLAGIPAISLPCGWRDGLPIGMQLLGKRLGEATLLQLAYAYEQAAGYLSRKAPAVNDRGCCSCH
jgi:aspartyl-tRNA(Asn)/glutamyl-tRNA(Gln) amidotransferase subunit A